MLSLLLTSVFSVPVVDNEAVQQFVDKNRLNHEGPAVITRLSNADLNGDGVEDHLIAFTFQWDKPGHSRPYMHFVVAFVSTPSATFDATNILLIPDSELLFYSDFEVEVRGNVVAVKGKKRTPTDAQCCPTARGEIVFGLVNGKLRAIEGSWRRDPSVPDDR